MLAWAGKRRIAGRLFTGMDEKTGENGTIWLTHGTKET
jgi:hypothetical protein